MHKNISFPITSEVQKLYKKFSTFHTFFSQEVMGLGPDKK